jgi:hypothetical protein
LIAGSLFRIWHDFASGGASVAAFLIFLGSIDLDALKILARRTKYSPKEINSGCADQHQEVLLTRQLMWLLLRSNHLLVLLL